MEPYRHTQVGWTLLGLLGAGLVGLTWLYLAELPRPALPVLVLAAALAVLGYVFGSLTVEVEGGSLRWWFGPGWLRWSRPLAAIASAERGRSSWWTGWGIRLTRFGWLYNVSGFDFVKVTLANGRSIGLGTDDPDGLLRSLSRHGAAAVRR